MTRPKKTKASEWAKREPRELQLRQMGNPNLSRILVFMTTEDGAPGMRIDNAGPFDRRESLRLAQWIRDYFQERR